MEHLSSKMEQQQEQQRTEWRRDKVQELCSKGYSQREISQALQVGLATVNRDISYLNDEVHVGVYASVERGGTIRRGDTVQIEEK